MPWLGEAGDVLTALRSGIDRTVAAAGHRRLNIVWAAGAGVVGTSEEDLERERQFYTAFLARLLEVTDQSIRSQLSLFLASSAGALYAGSGPPPFTETSDIQPLSPYGHSKLAMERASTNFAERSGVRVVIGRISNLYGPGQNLAKQQGLISQLARSYLVRRPILLYVSLDTRRDYLYVTDCARMILRTMEVTADHREPGATTVKILASGRSTTIAELLGVYQRLFKRRAPVVLGDSPQRRWQVRDLRMRSEVLPELDRLASTCLPAGIGATVADLAGRVRSGEILAVE